ncbi:phosphoadenylyl-sulfate reductase [Litoreibacter roseus]|uniref:Adenosine 5'-phosphosulfate reductase n=1 Tax=Litoreibacter roseus TaxID=2601869 RepID=A0A6N6JD07_9RHOB|nr:phosphoadenylyl-sulfate reductase [Litoreibacter roseus]GFE64035.1 phosphoadenylyl-sulfate reductase (thioredoxin) [Litoreibacter roseus]
MPLEAPLAPISERAAELNSRFAHHSGSDVLAHAVRDALVGQIAMVSSFGAESVVLLHMLSRVDRTIPVLFIDTEMLFPETLTYQSDLAAKLGLNVKVIRPDRGELLEQDVDNLLHLYDVDACCALRKTRPLDKALEGFDAWITGRKRYQGGQRAQLEFFEAGADGRMKVNPLAHFDTDDIREYMINNRLPRHPLVSQGYPSVGCVPCTTKARADEDPRAGRWRGQAKDECGIHFVDGKAVRGPAQART